MRPLLLLLFVFISFTNLLAQDSAYVTIKSGSKIGEALATTDIYLYPQFTRGEVFYRGGLKASAKMNYTRVFDEMLFIDGKGDTLALGDEKTIRFIAINRDTFYYDEGYVRLVADGGFIKLAVKQVWVIADIKKPGPHNTSSSSSAVMSVRSFKGGDGNDLNRNNLTLQEDIVLRKETQYFIGDEFNHFVRPGKKRLQQLFPKEQKNLENYLKESKVDFGNKDDIEKLYHYLSKLH